jgi:hypothetical protein
LGLGIAVEELLEGHCNFCVDFFLGVFGFGEEVAIFSGGEGPGFWF